MEIRCYWYIAAFLPIQWLLFVVDRVLDIDEKNMTYAKRNILQNNFKSRIRPLLTKPNDQLVPIDAFGLER